MFMRLCVVLLLCLPVSLSAAEKTRVVTTFSILADITREIGGDDIQLTNLVGADADAHVFEPAPAQVRAVLEADLVIANGLGSSPGWSACWPTARRAVRASTRARAWCR